MKKHILIILICILIFNINTFAKKSIYKTHLRGWGPIVIGLSKYKIESISKYKLKTFFDDPDYECKIYLIDKSDLKIEFMFTKHDGNYLLSRIYINDKRIKTLSNIGIGCSKKEIMTTYVSKIKIKKHFYTGYENLVYTPTDKKDLNYRIIFETDKNGIITAYSMGKLPEINYVEGCL